MHTVVIFLLASTAMNAFLMTHGTLTLCRYLSARAWVRVSEANLGRPRQPLQAVLTVLLLVVVERRLPGAGPPVPAA